MIVPLKELTQREKDAKNHRKKPALLVEGPEREPIAPIERPKREIVSRNAGSDSSSSEGRMKSPGETRALYRRTVRWEPEPREEASADVVMDEVQDSPPPIRTDEERMQALERIEVDEDPTAAHEAHLDQVHASDCRRGELVWVAGSCIQGRGSEFGRWPGIVKSKRLEVLTTSNEVHFSSSFSDFDAALICIHPEYASVLRGRTPRQQQHSGDPRRHSLPRLHRSGRRSARSQDCGWTEER